MGMVCGFCQLTKSDIEALQKVTSRNEVSAIFKSSLGLSMNIGKSWDVIHYLLIGDKYPSMGDHPLAKLFFPKNSTLQISEEEYDNSIEDEELFKKTQMNIRYLSPQEVKECSNSLNQVFFDELVSKHDFDTFNENGIYPEIWSNDEEIKEYVRFHFNNLKEFINAAAENGNYVSSEIDV